MNARERVQGLLSGTNAIGVTLLLALSQILRSSIHRNVPDPQVQGT